MTLHKYDLGVYSVITFCASGRKRKTWITSSYLRARAIAQKWHRRAGGSAVVQRTLYNWVPAISWTRIEWEKLS